MTCKKQKHTILTYYHTSQECVVWMVEITQDQHKVRLLYAPIQTHESDGRYSGSESGNSEYCLELKLKWALKNCQLQNLRINNHKVHFTVDTGSTINIIDQSTFKDTW